jgi:hypothetical protein
MDMKTRRAVSLLCFAALFLAYHQAAAFTWKDGLNIAVPGITVPFDTGQRVMRGEDPVPGLVEPLHSWGRSAEATIEFRQRVHDTFLRVPREAIRSTLGEDWSRAYDAITFAPRVQNELTSTGGRYLGRCLQGMACGPQTLVAGPVAALLRDAYKVYYPMSKPISPDLARALRGAADPEALQIARYVINAPPELNLPGFLNTVNEYIMNQAFAVTVGNVMIFSRELSMDDGGDVEWLLHEIGHISQYMRYSTNVFEAIDGFSVDYVLHFNRMERDAKRAAERGMEELTK